MRLSVIQLPDRLTPGHTDLERVTTQLERQGPDAVLLNEMPFGDWLAASATFDELQAEIGVAAHATGLAFVAETREGLEVLGSRPVWSGARLANEGGVLRAGRWYPKHRKTRLPEEPGWRERSWFEAGAAAPRIFELDDVRAAFLICSELMYTELARSLLHERVDVILVPRATGGAVDHWVTAAKMAAIWTGAYVLSSNRAGGAFNGAGFAVGPDGALLGTTDPSAPVLTVEIVTSNTARHRERYPCSMESLPEAVREEPRRWEGCE